MCVFYIKKHEMDIFYNILPLMYWRMLHTFLSYFSFIDEYSIFRRKKREDLWILKAMATEFAEVILSLN